MVLNGRFCELQSCWKSSFVILFPEVVGTRIQMRKTIAMLIVCGDTDCKGHAVQWLYPGCYSNRPVPHHSIFTSGNNRLREIGSLTSNWFFLMYEMPVPSVEDQKISIAAGRMRDMPGIY
ncbi:hypothetical protein TNCV_3124581 [Trichonephila clavipes]|nr:hypothetical protein TNCV_3124581 [Trichonephila clavipes]